MLQFWRGGTVVGKVRQTSPGHWSSINAMHSLHGEGSPWTRPLNRAVLCETSAPPGCPQRQPPARSREAHGNQLSKGSSTDQRLGSKQPTRMHLSSLLKGTGLEGQKGPRSKKHRDNWLVHVATRPGMQRGRGSVSVMLPRRRLALFSS